MMKQMLAGIAAAATLCGCASGEKYDKELNALLGQSASTLVQKMGNPSAARVFDDNNMIVTYTSVNGERVPSEYYRYIPSDEDGTAYAPFVTKYDFDVFEKNTGKSATCICQTSFWLKDGIVQEWRTNGNNCVAY